MGIQMNAFGDMLKTYAERNPDGISVIYGSRQLTWKSIHQRTNRLANALYDLGLRKGDKGAIMLHNCPEFIEATCALQKIGAIPSPLNYRFVASEVEFQVNHSDAKVFIFEDLWVDQVQLALPNLAGLENLVVVGEPREGMLGYEELIARGSAGDPQVEVRPEDVASLIYTGGTTGLPKGVVTSYGNYVGQFDGLLAALVTTLPTVWIPAIKLPVRGGAVLGKILGSRTSNWIIHLPPVQKLIAKIGPGLVLPLLMWGRGRSKLALKWLCVPPLFHMASFGGILETIWLQSGYFPIVLMENPRFDPQEVLEVIDREQASGIWMVPTMWKKLLELPDLDRHDVGSILLMVTGAGVCTAELKAEIFEHFHNGLLVDAFGQTEMTPVATMKVDSEPQKLSDRSVGRSLPGLEVRVVDEEGRDVPQGQIGEIIYHSDWIMHGYYKEQEMTDEVIRDGWFYSGDLGYFDEDGEVKVAERKKEVISTGGEKIFPQEVEEILERHAKVEQACLIGVGDDTYGQIPRAVIKLKEGESATEGEVIEWCLSKMTGFKRPKSVVFVDDLPLNPVGKVQRAVVKRDFGNTWIPPGR
jgi:acyl-CoA synthetase (AMP-forming)/AMP-acid ligase II